MRAAETLRATKKELATRVIDVMYADPFWMTRFGVRGRERSEEDIAYHVEYLAQSVESGDLGIMARYAQWLRTVLTSRGMCSRHLEESFETLEAALPEELALATHASLEAARVALRYDTGLAREVLDKTRAIADAVVAEVPTATPYAVIHLLSYVADALAQGKTKIDASSIESAGAMGVVDAVARHLPPEVQPLLQMERA